jgi:hypothetical protein
MDGFKLYNNDYIVLHMWCHIVQFILCGGYGLLVTVGYNILIVRIIDLLYTMSSRGSYITEYLDNWRIETLVFVLVSIILALVQIYVLKRKPIFSVFHSLLIAALVCVGKC